MYSDVEMLLTAALPIAHQDAGAGEQGNTLTFNRRKQLVERPLAEAVTQGEVDAFCAAHAVPAEVWDALRHATFAEFVATALVRDGRLAHAIPQEHAHDYGICDPPVLVGWTPPHWAPGLWSMGWPVGTVAEVDWYADAP